MIGFPRSLRHPDLEFRGLGQGDGRVESPKTFQKNVGEYVGEKNAGVK